MGTLPYPDEMTGSRGWRAPLRALAAFGVAFALTGAECPHCEAAATGTAVAAAVHDRPACHEAPSPAPTPLPLEGSHLECGCAACGVGGDPLPATAPALGSPALRASALPALAVPSRPRRVRTTSTDWIPPPYPGFFEHTVVLQS